jgi:hypothetical protein
MFNSTADNPHTYFRLPIIFLVLLIAFSSTACGLFGTHKKVQVPQLLSPLVDADTPRLIAEVNRLAAVQSIHGKVDIEFEDTSFAEVGIAEKYRQADGTVTLQRPGKIYLVISVPFIAKDIAQMTSDGEKFRVAVLEGDESYKRFVKGTNSAVYQPLDADGQQTEADRKKKRPMNARQTVSTLSNLRPQHLTDALMPNPIADPGQTGFIYVRNEFFQEEPDNRERAKKGVRSVRGYYLLEEISHSDPAQSRLVRRFWFDRYNGLRLARVQSFDERGQLITDVSYWDEKPVGEANPLRLPTRVQITRPHDHYKLSIVYQSPASVEINREYRPEAFLLENRWHLPEVDLDTRQRSPAPVTP